MLTIWKTVLDAKDEQIISVPKGAEFLCAREQAGDLCVWYRCESDAAPEARKIAICGTGLYAQAPEMSHYIGTGSLMQGTLIWHVFEVLA